MNSNSKTLILKDSSERERTSECRARARACVRACVRVCVCLCACVRACVRVYLCVLKRERQRVRPWMEKVFQNVLFKSA